MLIIYLQTRVEKKGGGTDRKNSDFKNSYQNDIHGNLYTLANLIWPYIHIPYSQIQMLLYVLALIKPLT